jgi:Rps23 Pro-64 3,4-dihydroxylase Tpa1-like proline 4-hydroxylase
LQLNPKVAREIGESLSGEYCFSEPFPHIVIDNFLPVELAQELLDNFPVASLEGDKFYENGYAGEHKRQIFPINCNDRVRNIFGFLNSAPILQFLEGLTTIDGLIPDPYFDGGGFHEIRKGGKLGVHADFRINEQLHLNRRLNMLIYLNQDWEADYGGNLEIWDKSMKQCCASIAPIFNRCVIFSTDADTYHGHPDPLDCPENRTRKSVALYYYTASKNIYSETPSHSTMYMARPKDTTTIKVHAFRLRISNYFHDFMPPILLRLMHKIRNYLK